MRTVAIVQARLGSSRLPRKIFLDMCARPVLEHVVARLRMAATLDEVVLAIPQSAGDDELECFCQVRGYSVFRGSEEDVLSRYRDAARAFQADTVVRVTSDCPLIDPELVNTIVRRHNTSRANDYTCNVLVRSYPRGVDTEVVSMPCLERLFRQAKDPRYREHVTSYVHDHLGEFVTENVLRAKGDRSDLRICVDTPEDFGVVEAVVKGLDGDNSSLGFNSAIENVIAFLDAHPEIVCQNAHVRQKPKAPRSEEA